MANEIKYIIWGIGMMSHAIYMLQTGIVSFGWDEMILDNQKLYFIAVPYLFFSLWLIVYSGIEYIRKK
jgi:hypothetical protein